MASKNELRRWRGPLAWILSAALIGTYFLLGEGEPSGGPNDGPTVQLPADERQKEKIEIIDVVPADPAPGAAVEIDFINTIKSPEGRKLGARLSVTDYSSGKQFKRDLVLLHSDEDRLIARIPTDAFAGRAKLRIGFDEEAESKPYDLRIRPISARKFFREIVGGLALLIFGMRILSRGSRQFTGQRSQGILARIGRRRPAATALGVVVGGITQFTTTAAGLVVGLVESHLLAAGAAVSILLGAHLGAALTPSILGLASTKEGLLVVAVGVVLLGLASDRRSEAFGKMVLGAGLLFFGLYLLRQGFEPLVSNPEIFPYLDRFHADSFAGRLTCVLAGVVLTAILQGPAPVFVLILGLAQSTGRIDLASALAILSGSGLGAALGTAVVASPFGAASRSLGRLHLVLAATGTIVLFATVSLWAGVAEAVVPGGASDIAYGKKVLLPRMGSHLVTAYAISQVAVTVLLVLCVPVALRLLERLERGRTGARVLRFEGDAGVAGLRKGLGDVLGIQREALLAISELCLTGHRGKGTHGEHLLADARSSLEALFAGVVRAGTANTELARLRQAALATVQLHRAIEDLLRTAEKSTEQHLVLSPAGEAWQLPPREEQTLRALHGLLLEGIETLKIQLSSGEAADLDEARSREIRLNAMEMDSRQGLLDDADRGEKSGLIALRLNSSELVNAYETVGNHLYRLYESLADDVDQETPSIASGG